MNKAAVVLGVAGLSAGLMAGYLIFNQERQSGQSERTASASSVAETKGEPLFYRNPMNPDVTSPVPAQDSMGMDYIPVYADADSRENPGTVKIDPVVQNNIGIRTAVAEQKAMSRTIRAMGRVDYNEEKMVRLHPKIEGWIEELRIDKTGQPVQYDDILLSIYSPKLVATQQEYLLALKNGQALKDSPITEVREGASELVKSSRERLVLLDVPLHQIHELEQSRKIKKELHIHSPADGTVLQIGARKGQYVTPATEIYRIADLHTVWVYADIYDYELPWVSEGDRVEMTLVSVPGRTFEGVLAYIYPYAEAKTRTTKVRMVFDNPDMTLRPQMFAEVSIKAMEKPDQIVIPAEAIVRSGDYDQIFVASPEGLFEPRKVVLGVESSGEVAVESGLEAGERVVVSAQFLIDSESKLREATAKMMAPKEDDQSAEEPAPIDHSLPMDSMQMEGMSHD